MSLEVEEKGQCQGERHPKSHWGYRCPAVSYLCRVAVQALMEMGVESWKKCSVVHELH
jgi:hypothetical protein